MKRTRFTISLIFILVCLGFFTAFAQASENIKQELSSSLRLVGTILEADSAKSLAIIRGSGSQALNIYRVGSDLCGYQIVKIMRGKVVLLKNGKTFSLVFPLGSEVIPIQLISEDERLVDRAAVAKKITDLNQVRNQVLPLPCIEKGKVVGFKVTRTKDNELVKQAGIKEGDIVTSINNQKLDSLQNALAAYHSARNEEKITVEIKRGNATKNLVYYLN